VRSYGVTLTINTGVTRSWAVWAAARALWSTCHAPGPSGRRAHHVRWQDIEEYDLVEWRKTFTLAPPAPLKQDAHRNIRYAGSTATTAQVDQLLRGAGLVRRRQLPQPIRGVGWGRTCRAANARNGGPLMSKAPLVVMDEPTSALDPVIRMSSGCWRPVSRGTLIIVTHDPVVRKM
jgi:ABC-type glutathione transport system ATPase component